MPSPTTVAATLAGLGISNISFASSSSIAIDEHDGMFSRASSGVETYIIPVVSPSEETILYPRTELARSHSGCTLEQVSCAVLGLLAENIPCCARVRESRALDDSDDDGYEAESEDDVSRPAHCKAPTKQFTRYRGYVRAAPIAEVTNAYVGLGLGLPSTLTLSTHTTAWKTVRVGLGMPTGGLL